MHGFFFFENRMLKIITFTHLNFLTGGAAQFTASVLCKGLLEVYPFGFGSLTDLSTIFGGADVTIWDSKYDSVSLVVLVDDHCLPKDGPSGLLNSFTCKINGIDLRHFCNFMALKTYSYT